MNTVRCALKGDPMTKIAFKSEHDISFEAKNPDQRLTEYFREKIAATIREEIYAFTEEVAVALRNMKPGQKRRLSSKPITITLEKSKDEPVL